MIDSKLQLTRLNLLVSIYLRACRARNLALGTIEFYDKKLNGFLRYCANHSIVDVNQLTPDDVRAYLIFLEDQKHRPAGIHCYYHSAKTFLKWYENEVEPHNWRNPIDKVKAPIVPLEPLEPVTIETCRALLETCKRGQSTELRDKAVLLLLLDTGVRLAEFLSLNINDVDLFTGAIQIRSGKGRKPRNVYLGEKSRRALRRYINSRTDFNRAVWISKSGERLTGEGLRMMLRRRAEQAKAPVPSPHDFRRAFAIGRWRAGLDILTISKLMGHSSLQVLNRYLKQMGEDLELAAKRSSPVDRNF